jgi:N-acyl-D-amino-acid deacylase
MRRLFLVALAATAACSGPKYNTIIRGGTVYDGSGSPGVVTDVGIKGDSIVMLGDLSKEKAATEIDATGMAVAPGFINMLSWAVEGLIADGRALSDIKQGVTLDVFGEGESMGPLTDSMKSEALAAMGDIKYDISWTTLAGYLDTLTGKGISVNVGSFIGAATVRQYVLGHASREPTREEQVRMEQLVTDAMHEGALGVGSSLIYEPGMFATTAELIGLARAAAKEDGMYISHIRNENDSLFDALDEFLSIARLSGARSEIYHLKAAGRGNWGKMDTVIQRIEAARAEGLKITTDMYTYPASSTGLDALMPGWVREGGYPKWRARLMDPKDRRRLLAEWKKAGGPFQGPGSADGVLLVGFKNDSLKPLTGKTLAQVAKERKKSPEETAMDLVIEDGSRVQCVYFTMTEDNLRKEVKLPYMSFGSDAGAYAPEGVFLKENPHPRGYGNFARLLAKYVREEKLVTMEDAIHRLTGLPASNLKIRRRGTLKSGNFADVVIFDPATIQDHATFDKPHQLATGMKHVFVNGVQVLKDGEHTGAKPGRVVKGPGTAK